MRMLLYVYAALLALASVDVYADPFASEREKAEEHIFRGETDKYLEIITRLSEQGDTKSQLYLGSYYMKRNEPSKAEHWLKKAAEANDAAAQYKLAEFYELTQPNQAEKKLYWLKRSANQGFARAKMVLDIYTGKANPSEPPPVVGGVIDTKKFVAHLDSVVGPQITTNEQWLACYRIKNEQAKTVYSKSADTCSIVLLEQYKNGIPPSQAGDAQKTYGSCIRRTMQRIQSIPDKELFNCMKAM